jgi:hypothetical protein
LPRTGKSKYKKDEPQEKNVGHCKVFDVVTAIALSINDGWMTIDEFDQVYLGVKERVNHVRKIKP